MTAIDRARTVVETELRHSNIDPYPYGSQRELATAIVAGLLEQQVLEPDAPAKRNTLRLDRS